MQRAFVVQLRTTNPQADKLSGRVEHLRSGRVAHFERVGELVEFFFRSLESEKAEESSRSSLDEAKASNPLPDREIG
jgi:hypothetical protein